MFIKTSFRGFVYFCILFILPWGVITASSLNRTERFKAYKKSVVYIEVTSLDYSFKTPWRQPYIQRSSGTGFIIQGKKILTNAHVVSSANTIHVSLSDQPTKYKAKVVHIAHDADLAMLSVADESFFNDAKTLGIGELPNINSAIEVVGFPIGGKRISITQGVISRIDADTYSHSRVDSHLVLQVDAAINPGNSGGPAIQEGKVIGVAFQSLNSGENLGYLIPTPIVKRFLIDIKDNQYHGHTELGILTMSTINKNLKKAYTLDKTLKAPYTGVFVYDIIPGSSADGYIKVGDILTKINQKSLTENGSIFSEGRLQNYSELVDNLHQGDSIQVEVLRKGKKLMIRFPSKITRFFDIWRKQYETPPSYHIIGGLVFQPLNSDLMRTYSKRWSDLGRSEIHYRYRYFFWGKIYKEVSEDVVLTSRLADRVNTYTNEFLHRLVDKVNGRKVKGFSHFYQLISETLQTSKILRIEFIDLVKPLILDIETIKEVEPRIFKKYGIQKGFQILTPSNEI